MPYRLLVSIEVIKLVERFTRNPGVDDPRRG